jgi:hypothetical protein
VPTGQVSEWDRQNIEAAEAHQAEFERRKLRDPEQLPDIADSSFVLHWDLLRTLKKHSSNTATMSSSPSLHCMRAMAASSKSQKSCGGAMEKHSEI